jgi:hypothetical protein
VAEQVEPMLVDVVGLAVALCNFVDAADMDRTEVEVELEFEEVDHNEPVVVVETVESADAMEYNLDYSV